MDKEEKTLYKFIENKILLQEFCEEYKRTKNNEQIFIKESEDMKLQIFQLENEIEKYKELFNINEKKKCEEIENNNFEYEIKIKKLEKQIDFLNTCLNSEKENSIQNEKELISLKYENNRLTEDLKKYAKSFASNKNKENENFINGNIKKNRRKKKQINGNDKKNEKGKEHEIEDEGKNENKNKNESKNEIKDGEETEGTTETEGTAETEETEETENSTDRNSYERRNLIVLNKIISDMDKKMEYMKNILKEITQYKLNIEKKMKEYRNVLNEYLKKISETNIKYDNIYNAYKEAEHKNNIHKWKKKKWKTQIEDLKRHSKLILEENNLLKQNIKDLEKEKKEYCELLRKAEQKNILFFQNLNKLKENNKKINKGELETAHESNSEKENEIENGIKNEIENGIKNEVENGIKSKIQNEMELLKNGIQISFKQNIKKNINSHFLQGRERKEKESYMFQYFYIENEKYTCRFKEFNIKKERKQKNLLFYSDNEQDKKRKKQRIDDDKKKNSFINSILC